MKKSFVALTFLAAVSLASILLSRCETPPERWAGTWATSVQLTEPRNLPPPPGLAGNTLRQVVRPSIDGDRIRVRLSNVFGTSPVHMEAANIAVSTGDGAIDAACATMLTFEGSAGASIPAGSDLYADPIDFPLTSRADVAITIRFGEMDNEIVTGHPGSRTTSYIVEGDAMSAATMENAATTNHWYIITEIDVVDPEAQAVITLGDSITDGRGSITNEQNRWPDVLAERLLANPGTEDVSVLNAGIGGNCVLRACLGPSAIDRFDRDVVNQDGARWLIILEGVNDIGGSAPGDSAVVAENLIAAFGRLIDRAHEHNVLVYGATIMPFGGSFYDSPQHEYARSTVNEWIRTSGAFDAVVDLDAALRDPENPTRLLPDADDGDGLHPSAAGHRMMAEAVDLALFQ